MLFLRQGIGWRVIQMNKPNTNYEYSLSVPDKWIHWQLPNYMTVSTEHFNSVLQDCGEN